MIPESIQRGLDDYVKHHQPTGDFLRAVLCNDLHLAVGRADAHSYAALREIVEYVHWEIPSKCHGSPAKVAAWLAAAEPPA